MSARLDLHPHRWRSDPPLSPLARRRPSFARAVVIAAMLAVIVAVVLGAWR